MICSINCSITFIKTPLFIIGTEVAVTETHYSYSKRGRATLPSLPYNATFCKENKIDTIAIELQLLGGRIFAPLPVVHQQ